MLYEKSLKQSVIDRKINEKETHELKKQCNLYLDERSDIMRSTQFMVEEVFGRLLNKASLFVEQITKLSNFSAKMIGTNRFV